MSKKVVLYSTSATGMLQTKKHITSIQNLLNAKKVPFEEVDCSLEENAKRKEEMKAISGTSVLPQVFVDGKYIGGWEDLEALNEMDKFDEIFK